LFLAEVSTKILLQKAKENIETAVLKCSHFQGSVLLKGPGKHLPTCTELNLAFADLGVNIGTQDSVYAAQTGSFLISALIYSNRS